MSDTKELQLTLTIDEVNTILQALGRMPFSEVYEVIGKINRQANEQLSSSENLLKNMNNEGKDA